MGSECGMDSAESEARKALNRLRRALEKAERELRALEGALSLTPKGTISPSRRIVT